MSVALGVGLKGMLNVIFRREDGIQVVTRSSGNAGMEHRIDVIRSDLKRLHLNLLLTKRCKNSEGDGSFSAAGTIACNNQRHKTFFSACWAASFSAICLLWPLPLPSSFPATDTSTVNVLEWSGPLLATILYSGISLC